MIKGSSYKKSKSQSSQKGFTAVDYYDLSTDRFNRFKPSYDPYIAYALVSENAEGQPVAHQFEFPYLDNDQYPIVKKLKEISFGFNGQNNAIQAVTEDGDIMRTQRAIDVEMHPFGTEQTNYKLLFFSPESPYTAKQDLNWPHGNVKDSGTSAKDNPYSPSESRGGTLEITFSNIKKRWNQTPASEDNNNDIMGYSALDAYNAFYEANKGILSGELEKIFLKSINAGNPYGANSAMRTFKRPEWCHALAKYFHPPQRNPQDRNNIGAAPLWMNSQMMVIEEALKWHAKKSPDAKISLKSHFNMFETSDVIQNGEMTGTIRNDDRLVKMFQCLNPHQLFPAYPQATDIALTTFVSNCLLLGKNPDMIPVVNYNFTPQKAAAISMNCFPTTFDDPELDQLMMEIDESQFIKPPQTFSVMSDEEQFEQSLLQIDESQFPKQAKTSNNHSAFTRQYESMKVKAEKFKDRKRMKESAVEPKADLGIKKKKQSELG